ncbi:MAG: hypothetical protein M1830_002697 [Pleopsidium flavum]|nr:MAG: hypothetical protein M1830_002697 [Pleopsidium flavum]
MFSIQRDIASTEENILKAETMATLHRPDRSIGDNSKMSSVVGKLDVVKWWEQVSATNERLEDCVQAVMRGLDGVQQLEQVQTILGHVLTRQEQYSELLATAYDFYEKNELYRFFSPGQQRRETLWQKMGEDFYAKVVTARSKRDERASAIKALEKRWRLDFNEAIPQAYRPGRIGITFAKMFNRFSKECHTYEDAWGTEDKPGILPPIIDARAERAEGRLRWPGVTVTDLEIGLKQLAAAKAADGTEATKFRAKRPQAASLSYKESAVSKRRRTSNHTSNLRQDKALVSEEQVTADAKDVDEEFSEDDDEDVSKPFDEEIEGVSADIAAITIPEPFEEGEQETLGSRELCEAKWQRDREEVIHRAQDELPANQAIDLVDNDSGDADSEEEQDRSSSQEDDNQVTAVATEELTESSVHAQQQTGRSTRQARRKLIEEATADESAKHIYHRKSLPENPAAEDDGPWEKVYVHQPNIGNYFRIYSWTLVQHYTGHSLNDSTEYTDHNYSFIDDFLTEYDLLNPLNGEIVAFTTVLRRKYNIDTAENRPGPHRIRVQNMCYSLIQQMLRQDPVLYAMVIACQQQREEAWKLISCPWHATVIKNKSECKTPCKTGLRICQQERNFIQVEYHLDIVEFDEHWIFPFDLVVLGGWTKTSPVLEELTSKMGSYHYRCKVPPVNVRTQDKVDDEVKDVEFEPRIRFPECSALGGALLGSNDWQSPMVNRDLCALFSSDLKRHDEFVQLTREKMHNAYLNCLHEFIGSFKHTWNQDLSLLSRI